ncbi:VWA domain-containing protein [Sphingomonas parva]|uniref:VWA domain-containing protein n=1 Tax=Sphingomonas parva TaxID=2555898 RepID=A0A4Y8ZR94_9SPHN|nr:vWA domain-containing protein [Sphingomonas parva]TFI57635.1 VWA domain-containing protein [Sphingomonas parva]
MLTVRPSLQFLPLLAIPLWLAACSAGTSEEAMAPTDAAATEALASADEAGVTSRKSEWSVAGIVRGKTETWRKAPEAAAPPPPEKRPQSGLLTAGDHDDLLNPELYADYASRFLQRAGRDLPFVDTRKRVAIKVVDADGRPVPFAQVEVGRAKAPLKLVAAADGVASFYPAFDRVPAKTSVKVSSAAGAASRALDLAGRSGRKIAIALPGRAPAVSAMDLALVIDTTGSMGDEMAYLQAELDSIVARLEQETGHLDLRIGVIVYRDEGDDYVVRSIPLTSDINALRAALAEEEAGGGGDTPEAVDQAIAAAGRMQWRPGAAKAMLLVADAPPHEEALAPTLASTQRLRSMGVQVVPVAASGVEDSAEYVMRTMAALTQGRYIFLTDDSGVGNPHAEPNLACYVVTHLDQLIGRVLAGIAEGRRIEPAPGEIVRTVGHYDRGRCPLAGITPNQS